MILLDFSIIKNVTDYIIIYNNLYVLEMIKSLLVK